MPAGAKPGERRGGRKKGVPNKTSVSRQKRAAATGILPADILLEIARYHYGKSLEARAKRGLNRDENEIRTENAMAVTAADKAAPYYHHRLATLTSNVNLTGRLTLEDLVTASLPAPANSNVPAIDHKPDVDETQSAAE